MDPVVRVLDALADTYRGIIDDMGAEVVAEFTKILHEGGIAEGVARLVGMLRLADDLDRYAVGMKDEMPDEVEAIIACETLAEVLRERVDRNAEMTGTSKETVDRLARKAREELGDARVFVLSMAIAIDLYEGYTRAVQTI